MNLETARMIAATPADYTDAEIAEARSVLAEAARSIAADPTTGTIEELRALIEAAESLAGVEGERLLAAEAAAAEVAELVGRLDILDTAPEDDEPADDDTPAEGDDGTDGAPDDISGIDDTPAAADPVNAPVPTAAATTPPAPSAAIVAAGARRAPARRVARPTPTPAPVPSAFAMAALDGYQAGDALHDFDGFANSVLRTSTSLAARAPRIWHDEQVAAAEDLDYGGGRKINMARFPQQMGTLREDIGTMSNDPIANASVLDKLTNATRRQAAQRLSGGALTAAGGCPCAPYPVDYNIFNLVESYPGIEADIPAVPMQRGGLRYMQCLDWRPYAAGTAVRTCTDENVAIGSYVPKPCVRITCPTEVSTSPLIIPACLTVGNFINNSYPEMVRQALEWLRIAYEDIKTVAYEDAIRANAIAGTNTTSAIQYGAYRDYFNNITLATVGYRARRHMNPEAPLHVYVPYWLPYALVQDLRDTAFDGVRTVMDMDKAPAWFLNEMRKLNLVVTFQYLKPTGVAATQWTDQAQTDAAAINKFPTSVETTISAPGVWNRGVIMDVDFGMIVDSPLIRTNDVMFFMETMVAIFPRCLDATELITSTLCYSGATAGSITPTCG